MSNDTPPTAEQIVSRWSPDFDRSPATVDRLREVLRVVDALAEWKGDATRLGLDRLPRCPRCRAASGEPCRRPNGDPFTMPRWQSGERIDTSRPDLHAYTEERVPRHHAPRLDIACRYFNGAIVASWRLDLQHAPGPSAIAVVAGEIHHCPLYLALVDAGHLAPLTVKGWR